MRMLCTSSRYELPNSTQSTTPSDGVILHGAVKLDQTKQDRQNKRHDMIQFPPSTSCSSAEWSPPGDIHQQIRPVHRGNRIKKDSFQCPPLSPSLSKQQSLHGGIGRLHDARLGGRHVCPPASPLPSMNHDLCDDQPINHSQAPSGSPRVQNLSHYRKDRRGRDFSSDLHHIEG